MLQNKHEMNEILIWRYNCSTYKKLLLSKYIVESLMWNTIHSRMLVDFQLEFGYRKKMGGDKQTIGGGVNLSASTWFCKYFGFHVSLLHQLLRPTMSRLKCIFKITKPVIVSHYYFRLVQYDTLSSLFLTHFIAKFHFVTTFLSVSKTKSWQGNSRQFYSFRNRLNHFTQKIYSICINSHVTAPPSCHAPCFFCGGFKGWPKIFSVGAYSVNVSKFPSVISPPAKTGVYQWRTDGHSVSADGQV